MTRRSGCPRCGSIRTHEAKHPKSSYRCTDCRSYFSVKTGTALEWSRISLRKWVFAIYLEVTSHKGVSLMKLHRDIKVTQKTAWFMLHRLREVWAKDKADNFSDSVEVDETYMGGKRRNMSNAKRKELADTCRRTVGKVAVVGTKGRASNHLAAKVVESTDKPTLQGFVVEHTPPGATVYSDEASAYEGLPLRARERQTQRRRVRSRHGAHERHGELLEHVEAGAHGYIPQALSEASRPVRAGTRRQAQHPRCRHPGADGDDVGRADRAAIDVRATDRKQLDSEARSA